MVDLSSMVCVSILFNDFYRFSTGFSTTFQLVFGSVVLDRFFFSEWHHPKL
jgi:hypothetical protein